jgi:hypothetical protein
MVERGEGPSVACRVATTAPDATDQKKQTRVQSFAASVASVASLRFTGGGNPSRSLGAFPLGAIKDATDATDATVRWAKRRSHLYYSVLRVATDATGALRHDRVRLGGRKNGKICRFSIRKFAC